MTLLEPESATRNGEPSGRRLILHIGQHKTGSTSLQRSLLRNLRELRGFGFDYFTAHHNHSRSLGFLYDPDRLITVGGLSAGAVAERQAEVRTALLGQIREASGDFILSGESMTVWPIEAVQQMAAELGPLFDDHLVVGYVRPPRSLIASWSQQRLKRGNTLADLIATKPSMVRYRFYFEKWMEVFGRDRTRLRLFHPSTLLDGDLLNDFSTAVGIPPGFASLVDRPHTNPSLTMAGGNLLSAFNHRLLESGYGRLNRDRVPFRLAKLLPGDGPAYRAPQEVEDELLASSADDIDWIASLLGVDFAEYDLGHADPVNRFDPTEPPPEMDVAISVLIRLLRPDEAAGGERAPAAERSDG